MFKKILHEPLVHFLVLGASIFLFYPFTHAQNDDEHTIVVSKAAQKQLAYRWQKKHMRPPTADEMQKMIDKEVYTEVMYQEALKMGLGKNDFIVRRRLAQKMEFVSNDLSSLLEPSDADLKAYLTAHANRFRGVSKVTFRQVYIDANRHLHDLQKTLNDIKTALDKNVSIESLGDSFMLPKENVGLREDDIVRLFGKAFEKHISTLQEGVWSGPVKSGYGLHFVYVSKREKGSLPSFESLKPSLKNAWMTEQKEKNSRELYETLKKAYTVKIAP